MAKAKFSPQEAIFNHVLSGMKFWYNEDPDDPESVDELKTIDYVDPVKLNRQLIIYCTDGDVIPHLQDEPLIWEVNNVNTKKKSTRKRNRKRND